LTASATGVSAAYRRLLHHSGPVCDLGFAVDAEARKAHGVRCIASLRQLRQIRRSVPSASLQMLMTALAHSRLDYGNDALVGIPAYLMRQLRSVMNAAARLICRLRTCDRITDALISIHWLWIPQRKREPF